MTPAGAGARGDSLRSNSCNFVPVEDVARSAAQPCPLVGREPVSRPRERALYLRLADRMRLYATTTSDFSPAELRRIKEDTGQIYADRSSKLASDDFARDFLKLTLAAECRACPKRPVCPTCFVPVQGDAFAEAEVRLRAIVGGLSGRLLDIGCGEGRYLDAVEPQAAAGKAEYLGLDPDRERLALLSARHPFARYHVGTVEDLAGGPARFEHLLMLRSYNHLPDPARTLDAALSLLEPGGTLLCADNVAFGLLRSGEHAALAEAGPGALEHARNDSAQEASLLFEARGLVLRERRDVEPSTGNQWLLWYEKPQRAGSS